MERAVGEIFEFEGVKLQVKDTGDRCCCDGCYFCVSFYCPCHETRYNQLMGECYRVYRADGKDVIFVEVKQ